MEALNKFYNDEVKRIFTDEVSIAKKCFSDLPEFELKFRKMKTRWGVCYTKKNSISISSYLIHYPFECLEYIIVHELTHFIVPNHSKRFYNIVSSNMPDYKKAVEKLKL